MTRSLNSEGGPTGMTASGRPARLPPAQDQLMLAVKVPPFWNETLPPPHAFGTLVDPW